MLACQGTLIAISVLGALGISRTLNPAIVVEITILSVAGLFFAHRRHGFLAPSVVAVIGGATLIVTSFLTYRLSPKCWCSHFLAWLYG